MKKSIFILLASILAIVSCDKVDSLLDTTNYQKEDTESFPTTEKGAERLVNSTYYSVRSFYAGSIFQINLFRRMIASDDVYGGGSSSSKETTASDRLLEPSSDEDNSPWKKYYEGLHRCNFALQAIDGLSDDHYSGDNKNWFLGQVHFMRGFFLWELAERYETFPLTLTVDVENMGRATVDEIYAAIAEDLTQAINLIPAKYGYSRGDNLAGRATKYAAEALMGRVWLFYTGFYKKDNMAGITKQQVINWLEDCVQNSGFGLEADPRELWPYTNEYSSGFAYMTDNDKTSEDGFKGFDTYANKHDLHWVGNHSKETVWGVHFSLTGGEYNRLSEWLGMRNSAQKPNKDSYPYAAGSNANATVNPLAIKEWYEDPDYGPKDKRFYGSFVATNEKKLRTAYPWIKSDFYVELPNFKGHDSKEVERTLFYVKKYQTMACYTDETKDKMYSSFFVAMNGAVDDKPKTGNKNDAIYIRFADVLLMLDELKETVTGMNQIRARAGLAPYDSYSFERLQKERRWEFFTEGMRFNDLRRWYPEDCGRIIQENQDGGYLEYLGKAVPGGYAELPGRSFSQRYAKTRGFWMIPETQIGLQEGMLVQTPGFEDSEPWLFTDGDLPYQATLASAQ